MMTGKELLEERRLKWALRGLVWQGIAYCN